MAMGEGRGIAASPFENNFLGFQLQEDFLLEQNILYPPISLATSPILYWMVQGQC